MSIAQARYLASLSVLVAFTSSACTDTPAEPEPPPSLALQPQAAYGCRVRARPEAGLPFAFVEIPLDQMPQAIRNRLGGDVGRTARIHVRFRPRANYEIVSVGCLLPVRDEQQANRIAQRLSRLTQGGAGVLLRLARAVSIQQRQRRAQLAVRGVVPSFGTTDCPNCLPPITVTADAPGSDWWDIETQSFIYGCSEEGYDYGGGGDPTLDGGYCGTMDCGGGGGDYGGDPGYTDTSGGYCPTTDPNCLQPLSPTNLQKVNEALDKLKDSPYSPCGLGAQRIRALHSAGSVYQGNPNIPDGPNAHDGVAHGNPADAGWLIHIDADAIATLSPSALAGLLLHEGFHALGFNHFAGGPPYTDAPFSQVESCVGP